jgi:hypothetical protein
MLKNNRQRSKLELAPTLEVCETGHVAGLLRTPLAQTGMSLLTHGHQGEHARCAKVCTQS